MALYLTLAFALGGMVLLSVYVTGRIEQSVLRSVATSEEWAGKFGAISGIGGLVSAVDAPGNEVFLDGDVAGGRRRMRDASDSVLARLVQLQGTLPSGLPSHDSLAIVNDLGHLANALTPVHDAAESVFARLDAGQTMAATRHMAQMDRAYGQLLGSLRHLRADLGAAQDSLIRVERTNAESASQFLRLAGVMMLVLAVGGGWSGYRLAREAERQAAEREATMALVTQARADLEDAHRRLTAAHAELESFSYSVAHDLRAPLRSIHGFSDALEQDSGAALNADGRSHLRRIQAASLRMERLIDDMLKLARVSRQTLAAAPIDLSAVAQEVVRELQQAEPGRQVAVQIEPGLAAQGDPTLVRVLLQNLIGNAWKFTRNAAAPEIRVGRDPKERGRAEVFTVRDNGAGFDMAYAGKLFGAFQRMHTTDEFEGTGVGLATVQRIVHRHGGRVWAESAVGQGATFRFTLRRGGPADD